MRSDLVLGVLVNADKLLVVFPREKLPAFDGPLFEVN